MLVIADARLSAAAKEKLAQTGTFIPFATQDIVYEAIAGHPDIFFCQQGEQLVVAPNLPAKYLRLLQTSGVDYTLGETALGKVYPHTAAYNAVVTEKLLIHAMKITDPVIPKVFPERSIVSVKQGYVRCNLLVLRDEVFVTSDRGILKTLQKQGVEVHYFSPQGILLPGFPHGFLGGCMGIYENQVFVTGALSYFPEGEKLKRLLNRLHYETVELYDGPLFDGGGIFFLKTPKPE
jgi:hypothetical protein